MFLVRESQYKKIHRKNPLNWCQRSRHRRKFGSRMMMLKIMMWRRWVVWKNNTRFMDQISAMFCTPLATAQKAPLFLLLCLRRPLLDPGWKKACELGGDPLNLKNWRFQSTRFWNQAITHPKHLCFLQEKFMNRFFWPTHITQDAAHFGWTYQTPVAPAWERREPHSSFASFQDAAMRIKPRGDTWPGGKPNPSIAADGGADSLLKFRCLSVCASIGVVVCVGCLLTKNSCKQLNKRPFAYSLYLTVISNNSVLKAIRLTSKMIYFASKFTSCLLNYYRGC